MALYMSANPVQIRQGTIHGLQNRWGEIVRQARRVLVIGVQPYAEDSHIWGPLAHCRGDIAYVGSKLSFEQWKVAHRPDKPGVWLGSRWADCLGETADFLSERTDRTARL